MIRMLLVSTALGVLALAAAAQEGGEACAPWSVGFAYATCTREEDVQVYALPDGSVRRLTEDPDAAMGAAGREAEAQDVVSRLRSYVDAGGASMATVASGVLGTDEGDPAAAGDEDGTAEGAGEAEPMREASGEAEDAAGTTVQSTLRTTVRSSAPAGEGDLAADPVQRMRSGQSLSSGTDPQEGEASPWEEDGDGSVRAMNPPVMAALPDLGDELDLPANLPAQVTATAGQTVLLQMSLGHLNRIETPFGDPMVQTSQGEEDLMVNFDANFVYVSVTQPSTMFIHERGHPDPAIAVSLIPQKILPRQVRIDLPAEQMRKVEAQRPAPPVTAAAAPDPAKPRVSSKSPHDAAPQANARGVRKGPESRPANDHNPSQYHAQLLKDFSGGQVPAGFVEGTLNGFTASAFCAGHAGATFSFTSGRMIYSNELIVVRGEVTARQRVQLDERSCNRHPGTLAVAFSPKTLISPNNPTDFYIVLVRKELEKRG